MLGNIQGKVVAISGEGNLITDITAGQLRGAPGDLSVRVRCDEHFTQGIFPPEHGELEMTFLAVLRESGCLELEIVGESASAMLGIGIGEQVIVEWD